MRFRNAPYAVRYLVALVTWVGVVSGDIVLRIVFLPVMPFFFFGTGFGTTQTGAQMNVNVVEFYTRPLMRPPRATWRRLLGRGSSADDAPKTSTVEKLGDYRA